MRSEAQGVRKTAGTGVARHARPQSRSGAGSAWSGVRADSPYGRPRRHRLVPVVAVALMALIGVGVGFIMFSGGGPLPRDDSPADSAVVTGTATVRAEVVDDPQSAKVEAPEVRLAMIGDILQHHYVWESGRRADGSLNYDHIFAHVIEELGGFDIRVVNQETPLGGAELGFSGYPSFNGPQEMGDAEAAAGLGVVLRASNHAMDAGYVGLRNELSFWASAHPEVSVIGAVDPDAAAAGASPYGGCVWEGKGMRVALLNFTYGLNGLEDPNGAVALLDEGHRDRVLEAVAAADEAADAVVVFPHWGTEYQLVADDNQRAWAKELVEAGADVIIGGHPHVIEPFEVLEAADGRQVPCFWSVGNFVSTQNDNENLVGCVAEVTLRREADGAVRAVRCAFVPTVTHKGLGDQMTTYLLRDYTDELAASNGIAGHSWNSDLTQVWADDFCSRVLGEGYDRGAHELVWELAS